MRRSNHGSYLMTFGTILGALAITVSAAAIATAGAWGKNATMTKIEKKTCLAPDGVKIVYSATGSGEPALVFIHGGLADRTFWDGQLKEFSASHRTIALDLAGHGESGVNRKKWGIPEFGADVRAVVEAEKLKRAVFIGNSLGGPVAIETALLLPGCAVGVIGIDTFQSLVYQMTSEQAHQRAEAFRRDFAGSVKAMVRSLFHADADPKLMADAESRMAKTSPEAAYEMFLSLGGYDVSASARKLNVPLRALNGDLYPTDLTGVRQVKADFEVIVMPHTGHYPMLERPEEFNRRLAEIVRGLSK
jgi:pimeloyl-ACP methyl ester carboxylesterase